MGGEVGKMITVGIIWGATNALMRRATTTNHRRRRFLSLLMTWHYALPFAVNLTASAAFFSLLRHSPISVAVPVTNAATFASTAVVGSALGEATRFPTAALGTFLIIVGVSVCIF